MKILIVTQYFWPEEFRINDLAVSLKNMGHEISILTGMPNYPEGHFFKGYGLSGPYTDSFEKIPIYRAPIISRGTGQGLRLILNYISFVISASIIGVLKLKGNFDSVFVFEPSPITVCIPAIVIKTIKKTPVLFWVQDLWPETLTAIGAVRSKFILFFVRCMVKFIYSKCDRILMQSRAFEKSILALHADKNSLLYFPNSAEELYRPVILEKQAPERKEVPSGFIVMFAGNIGVAQDFDTILDAADIVASYPDIHFVVLGNGRDFTRVQDQIQKRALTNTVHLLGRQPKESMPGYFSLADVMLVSLKKEPIFALTIPAKVQSYLACAKPIIASLDGEGSRIIQEADAGITVPAESPQELANAIVAMYRMTPHDRQQMGEHGQDYFKQHFERTLLANQLNTWMQELTGKT
jgi:colanic acid biosynthesis glycosyl transferase WcaI